jgi:NADP-dependent 3-hydroxy acid dehydrogenase YdfG
VQVAELVLQLPKLLADNGFTVIAAARRIDRLNELAKSHSAIEALELDVTNQESVDFFVKALGNRTIGLLVNNAGGAFDSAPIEKAESCNLAENI